MSYNSPIIREDLATICSAEIGWDKLKNKRVLITGITGFIATYIAYVIFYLNETRSMNIKLVGLGRNHQKIKDKYSIFQSDESFEFHVHDVVKPFEYDEPIDYIIHAASQASPKFYSTDPIGTLLANTQGTVNLLRLAEKNDLKAFLFFSSSEVYGSKDVEIGESDFGIVDPSQVRSCYAESKRMGETMCVSWHHQLGVPTKIVRPFHTYGPGMDLDDGRVFADFVRNIVKNENITLNSTGSARRAFCYLSDAVLAYFRILLDGVLGEAYNVGNPNEEYSILELAELLIDLYPSKKTTLIINDQGNENYLNSKVSRNLPNINKIKAIGWDPCISAPIGFKRSIEYFYEQIS